MIVLCALCAGSDARGRAADDRQHHRPHPGRPGRRGARRDRHRQEPATGFVRTEVSDGEGRLSADGAAGRHLRRDRGAPGVQQFRPQGHRRQRRRRRLDLNIKLKLGGITESIIVGAESPLVKTTVSSVGGVVDVEQHREPAAQRPAVRQPGVDDPRRRPRLPLRPDQEHAVLAADRGRQRPQRQLPDRRRRQQRRHRRRPAAALPARGDPGVQLRHAALQGGVRPQQRRRDEHRHQERHEQRQGQLVHAPARQEPEREDRDREARPTSTSRTTAATSTAARSAGRSSRTRRTSSPRSSARSRTRTQAVNTLGLLPEQGRRVSDAEPREPVHRQGVREHDAVAVPVGALRPQHQLAGLRAPRRWRRRRTGATATTRSTRST